MKWEKRIASGRHRIADRDGRDRKAGGGGGEEMLTMSVEVEIGLERWSC